MRIGYFGDGPWAHETFDRILGDDELSIAFVVPRYDTQDGVLREKAAQAGIDFVPIRDVNAPEGLSTIADYEVDIIVSMSFDQIFRSQILAIAPLGAVNCHAGALPFYRGRNVLNWALINDADEFGVTVHFMDDGIDTGDIILQSVSPITDGDDYATLLDRAVSLCADTLHRALVLLARGQATRTRQETIHPVGFYCGRRLPGDEYVDWSWPSRRIFNFVRAITTPGPRARAMIDGREVEIVRAAELAESPDYLGTPGEIVGTDGAAIRVKTGDSVILLTEVRAPSGLRLRIGGRFRSSHDDLAARVARLEATIADMSRQ